MFLLEMTITGKNMETQETIRKEIEECQLSPSVLIHLIVPYLFLPVKITTYRQTIDFVLFRHDKLIVCCGEYRDINDSPVNSILDSNVLYAGWKDVRSGWFQAQEYSYDGKNHLVDYNIHHEIWLGEIRFFYCMCKGFGYTEKEEATQTLPYFSNTVIKYYEWCVCNNQVVIVKRNQKDVSLYFYDVVTKKIHSEAILLPVTGPVSLLAHRNGTLVFSHESSIYVFRF